MLQYRTHTFYEIWQRRVNKRNWGIRSYFNLFNLFCRNYKPKFIKTPGSQSRPIWRNSWLCGGSAQSGRSGMTGALSLSPTRRAAHVAAAGRFRSYEPFGMWIGRSLFCAFSSLENSDFPGNSATFWGNRSVIRYFLEHLRKYENTYDEIGKYCNENRAKNANCCDF